MEEKARDHVVRAMTADGAFRVIALSMEHTLGEVALRQGIEGELLKRLSELMAGAVMLRETIQPSRRVQVILKDHRGGRMVADAKPDGSNRGLINPGKDASVDIEGDSILQVNYTLKGSDLHQGVVGVPSDSTMSESLMRYMQESEQIVCVLDVQVRLGADDKVATALGYVVQLTPESERDQVAEMTKLLESYQGIEKLFAGSRAPNPKTLIEEILADREFAYLATSELHFGCSCSRERMTLGLRTLSVKDLGELLEDQEPVECRCDACGETYHFSTDDVAGMLIEKTPVEGLQN